MKTLNRSWCRSLSLVLLVSQFAFPHELLETSCGKFLLHAADTFFSPSLPLLSNTVWGTSRVRYRHLDSGNFVTAFPERGRVEQYYTTLAEGEERVVATYFLFPKDVLIDGNVVSAFYGTHFSVDPAFAGRGMGTRILNRSVEISRRQNGLPRLDYAYVESTNQASFRAFKALGYESLGSYYAPTFSRTFTQYDPRVERLDIRERPRLIDLLNRYYADHVLTDFEFSVLAHQYFVIRDRSGSIVAGAQCFPRHWYLETLPGFSGLLALHVIPRLPLLGRQIQRDMHFLRFGNIFVRSGHESELESLMTHLLNLYQVHTGLLTLDQRSPIYEVLRQNGFGIVNNLAGENAAELMVHPSGIDAATRERIRQGPIHLSLMDN